MTNLQIAKQEIKLIDIIPGTKTKKGREIFINPCPVCGHNDHFAVCEQRNIFISYSNCCKGGSIIDYFVESENITIQQAIKKVLDMAGLEDIKINKHEYQKRQKKIYEEQKLKNKKQKVIKQCYHKLTSFERFLRSIENKNLLIHSLLSFIENYTMRFVESQDIEKHYNLCMNFKQEFNIWYSNYCWFERRFYQ